MVKSRNLVDDHIQDVCGIPMFQKFVVEKFCLRFLPVLFLEYDQSNASLIYHEYSCYKRNETQILPASMSLGDKELALFSHSSTLTEREKKGPSELTDKITVSPPQLPWICSKTKEGTSHKI